MPNSLITRCPKCSTAFRVSDEVLSMAKGKVRCGQCFHIFTADTSVQAPTENTTQTEKNRPQKQEKTTPESPKQKITSEKPLIKPQEQKPLSKNDNRFNPEDDLINLESLQNLFKNDDLNPFTELDTMNKKANTQTTQPPTSSHKEHMPSYQERAESAKVETSINNKQDELAPWEVELAEIEAALNTKPQSTKPTKPIKKTVDKKATLMVSTTETQPNSHLNNKTEADSVPEKKPDYMVALQALAQTASAQARPSDSKNQHNFLEQLSAQESLAPLLEENTSSAHRKWRHSWLWLLSILLGLTLLASQVTVHFFDEGSRSEKFRPLYKSICFYYNCVLPQFEDVSAITIQHVRIQSHPSIKNTLLVNAIITNISNFSQAMPKIALEFFDLNGSPVAARLFSPTHYLHKDFLDITYMPPNTPIHLVIPIQDPGARAVTHQLKAFPSDTRSY